MKLKIVGVQSRNQCSGTFWMIQWRKAGPFRQGLRRKRRSVIFLKVRTILGLNDPGGLGKMGSSCHRGSSTCLVIFSSFVIERGWTFDAWIPVSFNEAGNYIRKDLNIPLRKKGPEGFARDCPLTVMGTVQASLTGEVQTWFFQYPGRTF
jgi:hypothetical protein